MNKILLLPLGLFIALVVFLFIGLRSNPGELPSPLINKQAPAFQLPQLHESTRTFSSQDMRGKVWLLNVWASWCASCADEHPLLIEFSKTGPVPIYGLNWRDKRSAALGWLNDLGNPYVLSAADIDGRVAIDYGVYGAPETYLIDRGGVIRYKHVGPITREVWQKSVLPLVQQLNQ